MALTNIDTKASISSSIFLPRRLTVIVCAAVVMALAAQVQIALPYTPVPVSLQTLALWLIATVVTAGEAAWSMGLYLALASLGAPVLAGHPLTTGLITSLTFGYLLSFPLAAWFVATALQSVPRRSWWLTAPVYITGSAIVLGLGTLWLAKLGDLELAMAWAQGAQPFLGVEAAKIGVATVASRYLRRG